MRQPHTERAPSADDLLTTPRASADFFGGAITTQTLEKWRSLGKGPRYLRIHRSIVYRRGDLQAWLDAQAVDPSDRCREREAA